MPKLTKLYENRIIRYAILVCLTLAALVSVYQGIRNALEFSQDFQWDAAKALSMRLDPYELSKVPEEAQKYPELEEFYRFFTDKGLKQKMEANQFPSLLMLLFPMTLFSAPAARVIWLLLNLFFTAGIIYLLRKTFFEKAPTFEYAIIILLMLAGTPYRNQIGVGQHTLFAFFFFMLAVYLEKNKPAGPAGVNTGLTAFCLFISYFKYTLTAPLALFFIYKKRYAEFAASVAGHIVFTGVAAVWLKKSFLYMITAPLSVASALTSEGGLDIGVFLTGKAFYAVGAVIAVVLVVLAVKMPEGREYLLFPVLLLWACIMTYHRTYDLFVFSAVSALFFGTFAKDFGEKRQTVYAVFYVVLLITVYFLLRLFHESPASIMAAAVMYYIFTCFLTVLSVKLLGSAKKHDL